MPYKRCPHPDCHEEHWFEDEVDTLQFSWEEYYPEADETWTCGNTGDRIGIVWLW